MRATVIIPAFNAAKFIGGAIESVLAQSVDCQIVVVDDASTDDTKAVAHFMASQRPNIRVVSNRCAKGPSGARNTGLLEAQHEYVAFLDADDLWHPNHLQEGIAFLDKSVADAIFFNSDIVDYASRRRIADWFSQHKFHAELKTWKTNDRFNLIIDNLLDALLDETFIHLQSLIVRRDVLRGIRFNEAIQRSEDRDFCIQLYQAGVKFAYKDISTGIYFRHADSLTSHSLENFLAATLDHQKIFSDYLVRFPGHPKLKKILCERHMSACYLYRQLSKRSLAARELFRSLCYGRRMSQIVEAGKIAVEAILGRPSPGAE